MLDLYGLFYYDDGSPDNVLRTVQLIEIWIYFILYTTFVLGLLRIENLGHCYPKHKCKFDTRSLIIRIMYHRVIYNFLLFFFSFLIILFYW